MLILITEFSFRSRLQYELVSYVLHIRPIFEYCFCVWNTGYAGDTRLLESVQRCWSKRVNGLANRSYPDKLKI